MVYTLCPHDGVPFEDGVEARIHYEVCEHLEPAEYEAAVVEVADLAWQGVSYGSLTPRERALYDEVAYDETRVQAGWPSELPKSDSFDDFMRKMLSVFPEAQVEEDNYGQLIVYTNLTEKDGKVVPFESD